jgi:valyl-tRNA synthetase
LLDEYRLSDAYGLLYNFAWSEVFDWYVEMAKTLNDNPNRSRDMRTTLGVVLRDLLKLFHPAIPFVTEELWSNLGDGSSLLISAPWPEVPECACPKEMGSLRDIVTGIRQFRSQHHIGNRTEVPVTVVASVEMPQWWMDQVASLARAVPEQGPAPGSASGQTRVAGSGVEVFIPLAGLVDVDAERPRIEKAIAELEDSLSKSESKLANENFTERAPADVVDAERKRVVDMLGELDKQRANLAELG